TSCSERLVSGGQLVWNHINKIGGLVFAVVRKPILNAVEKALNETVTMILNDPKFLTGKIVDLFG
ncbi:unnamed protein product, partial [Allacma fusca]